AAFFLRVAAAFLAASDFFLAAPDFFAIMRYGACLLFSLTIENYPQPNEKGAFLLNQTYHREATMMLKESPPTT
ncbi:MAG TPA: hypothetical protein HA340_02175, partial [Candidatus Thalassarchaeaceae archaeon]|nr:hypothetical protein [Candidatus Thalassarchaeaceae archaeon]